MCGAVVPAPRIIVGKALNEAAEAGVELARPPNQICRCSAPRLLHGFPLGEHLVPEQLVGVADHALDHVLLWQGTLVVEYHLDRCVS